MVETGWGVSTSRVLIEFYNENPLLLDKNPKKHGEKNIITKTPKPSSSDPTIWCPGVYCTCHQSLALVPSPVHTEE